MRLPAASKKKLLDSAKTVYTAYVALDFFKTKEFETSVGTLTFQELCNQAIVNKKETQSLLIDGINYQLQVIPGKNKTYTVQLSHPAEAQKDAAIKTIVDYSNQDILTLLSNQQFSLEMTDPGTLPIVTNKINDDYSIGGKGKVDLYRTHLVTLHNIIQKIQSEDDISNLLVALATGSGKTFVQALWMFVLSLGDWNGVFAIPGNLLTQFTKDLKRLLPDNFVNKALLLKEKDEQGDAKKALQSMSDADAPKNIVISSTEYLLDKHYTDLLNANTDQTCVIFDEQHLIMKTERRRVRLIELAKQKLAMFLSATPNKETYELSGNKPVAIMSSGQKQKAGQGQFPRLFTNYAKNVSDKNAFKNYHFWTQEFWKTIGDDILLAVTNSIEDEHSSAAVSLVQDLPFYSYYKDDERDVRWSLQVPCARRILCIIDNNEDLVNFCHTLAAGASYWTADRADVYYNGNLIKRDSISQFFGLPNAEQEILGAYREEQRQQYISSFRPDDQALGRELARKSLAQQLRSNIFHSLVEYVLTDITGLDEIEHNRLRKKDMNAFKKMVLSKFQRRDQAYFHDKLFPKLGINATAVFSELLAELSHELERNELFPDSFIDNWFLEDDLMEEILTTNRRFSETFSAHIDKFLVMGVMTGMQDAETPIPESYPFAGLTSQTYNLYDGDGSLVSHAKKRKLSSIEILDDATQETCFTPKPLQTVSYSAPITEEMVDNLAQLGFIGICVSNKKTEGYSDRNLHTVINIAEQTLCSTNSPETLIQGIGRNRGLDDTIEPTYIHALGRKQHSLFDLNHLKSNDYYPELFKAQQQFNKEYLQVLGADVGKKIIDWVHKNTAADESMDTDVLKRQVLKFIALALRDINNKNGHKIKLSRAQLTTVVGCAMDKIKEELNQIKKPYTTSLFITILGHILNFLSECYYGILRIAAAFKLWFREKPENQSVHTKRTDALYLKILSKTSFKNIISKMSSALEFKKWIDRKAKGIQEHVVNHAEDFFNKKPLDKLKAYKKQLMEALLIKMVVDEKKDAVRSALDSFEDLIPLLRVNLNALSTIDQKNEKAIRVAALELLKQVPGLGNLTLKDIGNFYKDVLKLQNVLEQEPKDILLQDPRVKEDLANALGQYLQGDFLKHLSHFLTLPTLKRIKTVLTTGQNAQEFVKHCLNKIHNNQMSIDSGAMLAEIKTYFKLENFQTLDEDVLQLSESIQAFFSEVSENGMNALAESQLDPLVAIVKNQVLPLLVNAYPLPSRTQLLREASDDLKIWALIKDHGEELRAKMEAGDNAVLADFILSHVCTGRLPAPINVEEEIVANTNMLRQKLQEASQLDKTTILKNKIFSPSSWFSLKKEHVADASIANILSSDDFINALSLMFPHDQWLELQSKIKNNYPKVVAIARVLLEQIAAGSSPDLPKMQDLFAEHLDIKLVDSQKALQAVETALQNAEQKLATDINDNPLATLNLTMRNKLSGMVTHQLLPILANYISNESKKEQFLAIERHPDALFEFVMNYQEDLQKLNNGENIEATALVLLNALLPKDKHYGPEDIANPLKAADVAKETLAKDIQKTVVTTYITSAAFREMAATAFNTDDFNAFMEYLDKPEQVKKLVDAEIAADDLSPDTVLNTMRNTDERLKDLTPLSDRIKSFQDYIKTTLNEDAFDKSKIHTLVADSIAPVLFHKEFLNIIDEIIGFLDVDDMITILEAMGKSEPRKDAEQMMAFIDMIRKQDKNILLDTFIAVNKDDKLDFDRLPLKHVVTTLEKLLLEVLDCHCYYNQQNRKGEVYATTAKPRIMRFVSDEVAAVQIEKTYNFFNHFSRKIFYIQGLNSGLGTASNISADSNRHITKTLERINSHILRPIWWGNNATKAMHGFIKFCRNVVDAIVSGYFTVLNAIKSALNWIIGRDYFILSVKHADSKDYNDSAFEYSNTLNTLDSLQPEDVKKADCPADAVVSLEDFVKNQTRRYGFFKEISEELEALDKEEDLVEEESPKP